jgi:hypothetical protein
MRIPDEMASLIRDQIASFDQRASARELMDMMIVSKTPGEIPFNTQEMSESWGVSAELIWSVAEKLVSKGLFEVKQGMTHDFLVCSGMKSSAGAIKKKTKRLDMAGIKQKAIASRAADLKLKDVGMGSIGEIAQRIPLEERNDRLFRGYQGWLPTALYGMDGAIFAVTIEHLKHLELEYPAVEMHTALELMFDDLRTERHSRPTVPNAPYWIREWLKKHGTSLTKRVDDGACASEEMVIEAEY